MSSILKEVPLDDYVYEPTGGLIHVSCGPDNTPLRVTWDNINVPNVIIVMTNPEKAKGLMPFTYSKLRKMTESELAYYAKDPNQPLTMVVDANKFIEAIKARGSLATIPTESRRKS